TVTSTLTLHDALPICSLIIKPDTIAPRSPDVSISKSITGRDIIVWNVSVTAILGWVKYSPNVLSATTIEIINGYNIAINHVRRNSIFKIKAIQKNMTKYNKIETNI